MLLDKIKTDLLAVQDKHLTIDFAYLSQNANAVLQAKISKPERRNALEKIVLKIAKNLPIDKCNRLSHIFDQVGYSFCLTGTTKPLGKQYKDDMHAFKQAFLMFDPDDPAKKIIDEFVVNPPNGNYLGLSQPFVDKHFANDDADAKKKAEARNAKDTDIKVSSFLTPNDMLDFNKEVCACEPFFMALLARFKRKDASYRGRNKRVEGLVIRSSTKYAKIQCTEANKFTPRPDPPEYLTYGIATPSPDKVICDHYEPYKTVFQGLGKLDINPGWIMLDYKNKRDKQNKLLVDVQPPYEIGVYVKFGTFD